MLCRRPPPLSLALSERVRQVLARADEIEPALRALVPEHERVARVSRSAAELSDAGGSLAGVICGVKDIMQVDGLPTRCGSALPAEAFIDAADLGNENPAVTRARRAGALILGKTTTTEFANLDAGATTNPWNVEFSPGGSSQGSAAAVAAGLVDVAFGTQTGGSVNRPAAYCGVAALKPSLGRVPRDGVVLNAHSLDTVGFFAAGGARQLAQLASVVVDDWDPRASSVSMADLNNPEGYGELLRQVAMGIPNGPYLHQVAAVCRAVSGWHCRSHRSRAENNGLAICRGVGRARGGQRGYLRGIESL